MSNEHIRGLEEEQELQLLPRKALIQHELKKNQNNLVMIVQKSIKNTPELMIELAEKNCKQSIEYQELQCMNKCYEPISPEQLSSYIAILGIQKSSINVFEEKDIITIPLINTFIYSNNKVNYFGQDVLLSKEDILSASINDFEHELITNIRKENPTNNHIKILNQANLCNYLNSRPEEKQVYKILKQKAIDYQLNLIIEKC